MHSDLPVVAKYSMCALICDVVNYCASSFDIGKIVYTIRS